MTAPGMRFQANNDSSKVSNRLRSCAFESRTQQYEGRYRHTGFFPTETLTPTRKVAFWRYPERALETVSEGETVVETCQILPYC